MDGIRAGICHTVLCSAVLRGVENHQRSLCVKANFLYTYSIVLVLSYKFPLSVVINQGGRTGITGSYTVYEDSHTRPETTGEQSGGRIGIQGAKGTGAPPLYTRLRKDFHEGR